MKLQYVAFKWRLDLPLDGILDAFEQLKLHPDAKKHNHWTRSIGDHLLQVEYRPGISNKERSFFWIRWQQADGNTDKSGFERLLAEWFYTVSQYEPTTVYWMQAVVHVEEFHSLYGFQESSPQIWTKEEKQNRYSFFPIKPGIYHFEVRCKDVKKAIQHHRFSVWLEDLKHNLLGHTRPNAQIQFDINAAG
ncbi:hypothetical protein L1N85_24580 [Paenibacillus alkaliterrae]|uniref:hypothetical protein n=1 Tax=Paenibacillus alkaliterrae TaxID=320909 RepID=UPI001F410CF2|nr:hypothetical protein [Paenibacillus alkaliterrae]MCF2941518.1 hypothetical protein [Paenibacillus alkaliterrae]